MTFDDFIERQGGLLVFLLGDAVLLSGDQATLSAAVFSAATLISLHGVSTAMISCFLRNSRKTLR